MLKLTRPSEDDLKQVLATSETESLSYEDARESQHLIGAPDNPGLVRLRQQYHLERQDVLLGHGEEIYRAARDALLDWRMFSLPWAELFRNRVGSPIAGETFLLLVRQMGTWSVNSLRVVDTWEINEQSYAGGSNGVPGPDAAAPHAANTEQNGTNGHSNGRRNVPVTAGSSGQLVKRATCLVTGTLPNHIVQGEELFGVALCADDSVIFTIASFSRIKHWLAWLGTPVARFYQSSFVLDSMKAMTNAVAANMGGADRLMIV